MKKLKVEKDGVFISDQLDLNKEKVEIAASVCKSDLVSGIVGEFPELQGVMGKYFALSQGFEEDVSRAIRNIIYQLAPRLLCQKNQSALLFQ